MPAYERIHKFKVGILVLREFRGCTHLLSYSHWNLLARAGWTWLSLLTCQRRFSLFSCSPNVENAHFSAWLETPPCHVVCIRFRFLVFKDVSRFEGPSRQSFCNQDLILKSGWQIQASVTTRVRAGSLTHTFDLIFLGEFDFVVPFVMSSPFLTFKHYYMFVFGKFAY